jgi:hypothetical protein
VFMAKGPLISFRIPSTAINIRSFYAAPSHNCAPTNSRRQYLLGGGHGLRDSPRKHQVIILHPPLRGYQIPPAQR